MTVAMMSVLHPNLITNFNLGTNNIGKRTPERYRKKSAPERMIEEECECSTQKLDIQIGTECYNFSTCRKNFVESKFFVF